MRWDCCGKKKCLLESYERIKFQPENLNVCAKCGALLYGLRDAARQNDTQKYNDTLKAIESKMINSSVAFQSWEKQFISKKCCNNED